MLRTLVPRKRRILMTVDAVGGVWRYALDLGRELVAGGDSVVFAGLGPLPSRQQAEEARSFATLIWLKTPLDWMTRNACDVDTLPSELRAPIRDHGIDLVHLNAPTQAAGLDVCCPVVVASHSCVVTWFHAVKGGPVEQAWAWHKERNRQGFDRADAVVAPSRSHADMLEDCYGPIARLSVVANSVGEAPEPGERQPIAFAAGRWWDQGKNAAVLDRAASVAGWPILTAGPLEGPACQRVDFRHAVPLGPLPHHQVRVLMGRSGLFVSPSLYEPFGLAVLEAAASGTPLLLADVATYRELWDGAAMFHNATDPYELAACINLLAGNANRRRELGKAAARRSRRFSVNRQAAAMRTVYDRAALARAER